MAIRKQAGEQEMPAPAVLRPPDDGMGGELDKVRSILFGEQIRAYETRLRQMETAFAGQLGALRDEMSDRFASVDQVLNAMMARIEEHLAGDRHTNAGRDAERRAEIAALGEGLQAAEQTFAERLRLLEDEYRAALAARAATLETALDGRFDELAQRIQASHTRLETDKVDRRQMATLMHQLAEQVSGG